MSATFNKDPDFIFPGAGCASLSLLMRMINCGRFTDKKILLIDKESKTKNDRTWCFWEKDKGFFEEIVYHKWRDLKFLSNTFSSSLDIEPYEYKMIRGIDFYTYCFDEIKKHSNIEIIYGEIKNISSAGNIITIDMDKEQIKTANAIVFNSIYDREQKDADSIYLLQHFKGWVIETQTPTFNPNEAVLMDFRVHQNEGATFAYTLPLSETKALVEYTLFTADLLKQEQYDLELKSYINDFLKIERYKIVDQEFGIIPMTNEKFRFFKNGIYHIGTAGGQTKASSGYTFQFIQKQSKKILDCLVEKNLLQSIPADPKRFHFYDTVLLRLLSERKLGGDEIFSRLFQRNKASSVFKFLDNETSIREELKLISTLPVLPFLKAAINK